MEEQGFSLLELLAVLAVMTVLGGIGLSGMGGLHRWIAQHKSQTLFHELQTACLQYRLENDAWPDSLRTGELVLNGDASSWRMELAPYLEQDLRDVTLTDGRGNADLRLVVDVDGDHWIRRSHLRDYSGQDLWARVALYSVDAEGRLAWASWRGKAGE